MDFKYNSMTQTEYERKKRECWEEYCQTHPLCNTPVMRLNFDWTFDRAYALGKGVIQKGKTLDTYLTDEDIENVRAEYKAMVKAYESPRNSGEKEYAKGYMEALEWLFGIRFLTNKNK